MVWPRAEAARLAVRRAVEQAAPLLWIGGAAALGMAVVVAAFGGSPLVALQALVRGAVGSVNGLTESTLEAIPLVLTGLGVAIAFQCHLWNIGAEGQLLVGELAAIAVGVR